MPRRPRVHPSILRMAFEAQAPVKKAPDAVDRALSRLWLVGYDNLTEREQMALAAADRRGEGGKN